MRMWPDWNPWMSAFLILAGAFMLGAAGNLVSGTPGWFMGFFVGITGGMACLTWRQ